MRSCNVHFIEKNIENFSASKCLATDNDTIYDWCYFVTACGVRFQEICETDFNPDLKSPRVTLCPTRNTCGNGVIPGRDAESVANGKRIRGLVLLLRYTGMRIGDAVNFSVERLKGNRVFLYTQKTGVAVNTVLPDLVVDALAATPKVTDKFYFGAASEN